MQTFIIVILIITLAILLYVHLLKNDKFKKAIRTKVKWVDCFERILDELRNVMENKRNERDWIADVCSITMHEFDADGAIFYCQTDDNDDSDDKNKNVVIRHLDGICRDWNLEIVPDTNRPHRDRQTSDKNQTGIRFEPNVPPDFYWTRQPNLYVGTETDQWLPPIKKCNVNSVIVAPLKINDANSYLLLLRLDEKPVFDSDELMRMNHCVSIAEAGFDVIAAETKTMNMERELRTAHEEGMLQISTGIIHNVGNGITVIQLALERMKCGELESIDELSSLMETEVLSVMREKLAAGTLQEFLTNDPQGKEYLGALTELTKQISKVISENRKEMQFVMEKFRNVTEVITLQQQFIGELGTENVCSINVIVNDVLTLCQDAVKRNGVELTKKLKAKSRILVDSAMMRHMIFLLMKYAIESAACSRRSKPTVKVLTDDDVREDDGKKFVKVAIFDNGAGRDQLPNDAEFSVNRRKLDEQTKNLLFIRRRIIKYGGIFEIKSEFGMGTRIIVKLPSFETTEKTDDDE